MMSIEAEKREIEREKRLNQLEIEGDRLPESEYRVGVLLFSPDSTSQAQPANSSN